MTCFACGYDLRETPADGRCPECGLPVAETRAKLTDLATHGDPRPVGRACLAASTAAGLFLVPYLAAITLGVGGPAAMILPVLGTLGAALLVGVAAFPLARSGPAGGRLNRRLLGAVGWIVPACVILIVGMVVFTPTGRARPVAWLQVAAAAPLLTGGTAAMLFPPLMLGELRRRVRPWPHWAWLPRAMNVVRLALLAAAVLILVPSAARWVAETAFGWSPYEGARLPYPDSGYSLPRTEKIAAVARGTRQWPAP